MTNRSISVILPYYKEGKSTLEGSIKRIGAYLKKRGIDSEIIISQNGTKEKLVINNRAARLINDPKKGLGIAIKNALKISRGKYSYFLSCEVPFELSDLKQILALNKPFDLAIGSKLHPKSVYKISLVRYLPSQILSIISQILIPGFSVKDPNGTLFGRTSLLKKYSRQVETNDFFYPTELVYNFLKNKHEVVEVPIVYIKKGSGSSVRFFSDGLSYLFQIIKLALRERFRIAP